MQPQATFSSTCPSCGARVSIATSGTGFCSKCGSHAALVPPPAEGWNVDARAVGGQAPSPHAGGIASGPQAPAVAQGPLGSQGPPPMPAGMAPARPELVEVPEPERATHSYIVESRRGPDIGARRAAARKAQASSNLTVALALLGVVAVAGVLTVALV